MSESTSYSKTATSSSSKPMLWERERAIIESGRLQQLDEIATKVFLVLLHFANWNTAKGFVSSHRIARVLGETRDVVERAIENLDELGFIRSQWDGKMFIREVLHPRAGGKRGFFE